MIEKLSEYKITRRDGAFINVECNTKIINTIVVKINELVDAVNELQLAKDVMFNRIDILNNAICDIRNRITTLDDPTYHEAEPEPAENVQDKFAEQREWIGCLVEYGNADDGFRYGILTNIEPRYSAYPFEIDNGRDATADCWLPSKTIFYKGGNNE